MTQVNVRKRTVVAVQHHASHQNDSPRWGKTWLWLALAGLAVWLVCMGVNWLAARAGMATAPSPPLSVQDDSGTPPPITPPEPTPTAEPGLASQQIMPDIPRSRAETIRVMGENLRRHAREDPGAPDALPEDRIKAILERGAPID